MTPNQRASPERRAASRRSVPTQISVAGAPAQLADQSANGVAFESRQPFVPGEEVLIVLPLPNEPANTHLRATCHARIVRVERRGALYRVAATYQFTFAPR